MIVDSAQVGYVVVGVFAATAGIIGALISKRGVAEQTKVNASTGVVDGYSKLTDDLAEQLDSMRAQMDALAARLSTAEAGAARAERALNRAELVIDLLVRQLRSIGVEPDLPAHLAEEHPAGWPPPPPPT